MTMDREHPNFGDEMIPVCPMCGRDEHSWDTTKYGHLVCRCGELIEGSVEDV